MPVHVGVYFTYVGLCSDMDVIILRGFKNYNAYTYNFFYLKYYRS